MSCGCASGTSTIVGSTPTVTFMFTDVDGDPANPTALSIRVLHPNGTTVDTYDHLDVEVTNPAVGTWAWRPSSGLDEAGEWWVYALASGGGTDVATEASFVISDSHVPLGA